MTQSAKFVPLSLKPDLEEAAKRWAAYYAGEIIDRPVVCVTAPRDGCTPAPGLSYRERAFGDIDELVTRTLATAEAGKSGKRVFEAKQVNFAFGEKVMVKDFNTVIQRGDKIGLIGGSYEVTPVDLWFDYFRYDATCPEAQ